MNVLHSTLTQPWITHLVRVRVYRYLLCGDDSRVLNKFCLLFCVHFVGRIPDTLLNLVNLEDVEITATKLECGYSH